ncbi:UNVERIFIED_CONTAM: hypothetical protein K2H54_031808 [Gekko kuhli]
MRSTYIQRIYINAEEMKSLLDGNWLVDTVIEGFLLTRAILTTVATTDVDIPVAVEPAQPLEGQDLTLTPGGKPIALQCSWYREQQAEPNRIFTYVPSLSPPEQQNGPNFTGRETGGPGCSLHIRSLRLNDTGDYVVTKTVSGGPETGRVHIRVSGPELVVQNVTPEHSGNYVCQAENVLTLQKSNSTLEIEVEGVEVRDVTVTGPSVATEDLPVTLTCTAVGSSVSYSWFKGNQSMEPGQHVVLTNTNQNLTFDPSHRSDSGDYTCRGSNSFSSGFSEPHWLDILYGPDPPVIHELVDRERFKVHLSCQADSYPAVSYIWFLNGKFLPDQQNPLVRDLAPEHGGSYTCQAENGSTGQKRNTTLELEVRGK